MPLPLSHPHTLSNRWAQIVSLKFNLDVTRGKPSDAQVALSLPMFEIRPNIADLNYGGIEGHPAARKLFGDMIGASSEQTFTSGGGSLSIMHRLTREMCARAISLSQSSRRPAMICLDPGYDRHFALCRHFGIDILRVRLNDNGPDMDAVKELARRPEVIGMWCVPMYSNPSGITYSAQVCGELATMPTNPDFRIFWDLAYCVHHLVQDGDSLPNMLQLCERAGHRDRAYMIASTSKMTCPDAGLGIIASSETNMEWYKSILGTETIGHSKLLQLQHVAFFRDLEGIKWHMAGHRNLLRPKFDLVQEVLQRELGNSGLATWSDPRGGYFVGLTLREGISARNVVARAKEGGLLLTPAGSSDPYGEDDSFVRIAPTFPELNELERAMRILTTTILIEAEA